MLSKVIEFFSDKSGAVTVDWVALTGAVVVIGIGLSYAVFAEAGVGEIVTQFSGENGELTRHSDAIVGRVPNQLPGVGGTVAEGGTGGVGD